MNFYLRWLACLLLLALSFRAGAQGNDIAQATQIIEDLREMRYDHIISAMKPSAKSIITKPVLKQLNKAIAQFEWSYWMGTPSEKKMDGVYLRGNAVYSNGMFFNIVTVFDRHLLTNLFIEIRSAKKQRYRDPDYKDTSKFIEEPIVLRSGPFLLPGTLTTPTRSRRFPVIILVHGSGRNDRDEALDALKPFRDLAVGLAAKGIATVRYDKRNKTYNEAAVPDGANETVALETTDDAAAAIKWAAAIPGVDSKQIYVLGHSQGGMMLPRIMLENQVLAGGIIMSGPSGSLLQSLEAQFQKVQLNESTRNQVVSEIAQIKQLDANSNVQLVLLGHTAGFWLDIMRYDQLVTIQKNHKPLLILQGGRDAQVPFSDLSGWQKALPGHPELTTKVYPKLNHFYSEGTGEATTLEYNTPGNVPGYVINDIAAWVFNHISTR